MAETPPFEYVTGGDDDVRLRRIGTNGPQAGTIGPRPDHVLFWLSDGRAVVTADTGERWEVEAGRPVMLSAPVAYAFETDATRMTLLHLSPSFLHTVAARADAGTDPWEFVQPVAGDIRLEPLRTLLREVTTQILDPGLPDADRRAVNRRVAKVVLSTFTRSRSDVENRLRRVVRFVHEHAAHDVTVGDIGDAAGLSERGVQDLFRRTLDVTPMQYLREVRLDRVHLELQVRRRGVVTVREVAGRWQFAHLGRFAAAYRRRFGESPNETLARTGGA
ncbi:AraC-like DNA-binding protein [Curtobacterium sp. PhB130]|uniref:helix-turn-helix transcriptional regulator n=1 Tax=unclassified Curtobacterium TaxID=257496 RepID=UPI000FC12F9C|nr:MULTISPECIES: AraC family transcriptional regulator [unclassified Curtobacterium]ROP65018.1 AraC-like DNA-binding protein [Curtobacterium sp. ZW137]ROS78381.1 AraC-like DNA-binding protein [Curtobacterium sp. PhB130]TCK65301.1 AraC-like DNA-binding protein [Curtobacterium sp. PhB136]